MKACVVGLILAAALQRYRVDVAGVTIRAEHLALAAVACVWLPGLVRERRRPIVLGDDGLIAGFLGVAALASLLSAPRPAESLRFLALMAFGVGLYWLVRDIVARSEATFRVAVHAFVVSGVAEAALAIVRWATIPLGLGPGLGGKLFGFAPGGAASCVFTFAPRGTFTEPGILGGYLAAAALPGMVLLLTASAPRRRRWLTAAIVVVLVGLGLTLSRGAWLGLAGGLVLLVIAPHAPLRARLRLAAVGAAVVAVTASASVTLSPLMVRAAPKWAGACEGPARAAAPGEAPAPAAATDARAPGALTSAATRTSERVLNTRTIEFRWENYRVALEAWRARPWIGNGPNSFGQTRERWGRRGWISNLELMTLHDTGVLGLGLLAAWLAWVGRDTLRAVRRARGHATETTAALSGLAAGFAALLIGYQTTTAFWVGFTWVYLALIRGGTLVVRGERSPA